MGLSAAELQALDDATEECALAINDAIVAITPADKLAAKARYKAGMKSLGKLVMQLVKHGIQGDY
jgi:hypothetical protein